jgi:hypothetical protein
MRNVVEPSSKSIWGLVVVVAIDRVITLHYFGLEANPLVTALGPIVWSFLSVGLCAGYVYLWYEFEGWEHTIAQAAVTAGTLLYVGVILINSYVIVFVA